MEILDWMSLLLYSFLGLLVICVVAYYGINSWVISNEADKVIARKKQKIEFVRNNWVMAPAIIRYAKRVNGHRGNIIIDFEVEVQLDGYRPFLAVFRDEIDSLEIRDTWSDNKTGEYLSETGRKIWIYFDPNDPPSVYFDHFDDYHNSVLERRGINGVKPTKEPPLAYWTEEDKRIEFERRVKEIEPLRATGEDADAVILQVEDLFLKYLSENSCAMKLKVDVISHSGETFIGDTYVLIKETSLAKYSAGRKVHVRVDPHNREKIVLLGSAETSASN